MIGETVGDYKITGALGTGGVGEMFSAEHTATGVPAAVEIVTPQINPEATAAYLDAMRKVQALKHPGLAQIFDVGVDGAGRSFVAMAPIEGEPLAKRIADLGRLSITQIGEIARQLANALAAVHDEGLIHGDLKASCVFLMPQGALAKEPVKLLEVGAGLAKRASAIPVAPVYTAPEVWSANASDWRIDAYSLGCVVFEMATGKPPYQGKPEEIRAKHLSARPPSARSQMPDVPPALDVMLGRLLSKAPEDRYGSMREIARAFEMVMGGASRGSVPTEQGIPVFQGEIGGEAGGVTSGELKARSVPPPDVAPAPPVETASVVASGAEVVVPETQARFAAKLAGPAPGDTANIRKQGGFPIAIVLVLLLAIGGGIALYATLG